jgi:hypothetical protein
MFNSHCNMLGSTILKVLLEPVVSVDFGRVGRRREPAAGARDAPIGAATCEAAL